MHGLVLGDNKQLYDTKQGQQLPDGVKPMPQMSDAELALYPECSAEEIVPHFVARYNNLLALAANKPANVIAANGVLKDRPGFEVDLITRGSIGHEPYTNPHHEILMVMRGHWRLSWEGGETTLAPGDTCAVPPGLAHALWPSMSGEASLYRVVGNDDPAGPTLLPDTLKSKFPS